MKAFLLLTVVVLGSAVQISFAANLSGPINGFVPPDNRPCLFFSIAGFEQADPIKPGWPWIAVRQNQNGFKEIYAFLLAAKASGWSVAVETSGEAIPECDGYVGLSRVWQYTP